jgi:NAD(P)-dependent dehydrogenase (short-subunit alcohol dehydrogenase family)
MCVVILWMGQLMALRFENKVAVITGAASGIGLAAAMTLSESGANVVCLDVDDDGLEALRKQIEAAGRECETVSGSVADLEKIDQAIAQAVSRFGGLDLLVNNAGIAGPLKKFHAVDPADFDDMVAINLRSAWYGIKAAHAPMVSRGGGAIVNVASMAGLRPNRHHSLYGMTKAGVISLTQHAAMDFAVDNIRVNCLCPGPVETPIFEKMRDVLGDKAYETTRQRVQRRTVMNRYGTTGEQAAAISFLLSDEATFITGIAMPVDGGWSISDGHA